jgi:starch synthase
LREYYKNDPLFADSKIVTSAFNYNTSGVLSEQKLIDKIKFDQIDQDKLGSFADGKGDSFAKVAIENSDAVILGSEELSDEITDTITKMDIPVLEYHPIEGFTEAYSDFYLNKVL